MKLLARLIAPSLLLFACAPLCPAQSAAPQPRQDAQPSPPALTLGEWKEFAPAGGGFSILFPGTPQSSTQTVRLNDRHTTELQIHTVELPTLECSVVYAGYPIRDGDTALARTFLDSAAKSAVADGGQLLSFTEIEHEGHPGRMLRRRIPDGKILRAKIVLAGRRHYQIACETPREDGASAETLRRHEGAVAKFIDSFKLGGATTPTTEAEPPGEVDQYLADHPRQVLGRQVEGGNNLLTHADQARIAQGAVVSKPQPPYPAVARAARVSGVVVVWVVVDEEGKVVAAQAVSGHPLLRAAAVKAAREARFAPTLLDGKPVKVSGAITYNFNLQ